MTCPLRIFNTATRRYAAGNAGDGETTGVAVASMAVQPPGRDDRPRHWWRRFRLSRLAGVRIYELREVHQIEAHILERLSKLPPDPDRPNALEQQQRLRDWVASRFTYPLRSLLIQAKGNGKYFFVLNTVVVAGGFGTSGIAIAAGADKGSAVAWVIFAFGLLVAVAGGITQVFRPGHRASERLTLVMKLREDGWAFANGTGLYAVGIEKAFRIFDARLTEFHREATNISLIDGDEATITAAKATTAAVLKSLKEATHDTAVAVQKTAAKKTAPAKTAPAKRSAGREP